MVVYKRTKNLTKYNRDASDSHHQCIILRGPIGAFKKLSRCINMYSARGGLSCLHDISTVSLFPLL